VSIDTDHVRTTHVGSLPRPEDLVGLAHDLVMGDSDDQTVYDEALAGAVREVVKRQKDAGIDAVNDGEFGHAMPQKYDFGAFAHYAIGRLAGFELVEGGLSDMPLTQPEKSPLRITPHSKRRDWVMFKEVYEDPETRAAMPPTEWLAKVAPVVRGPLSYTGQDAIARDIANLKAALDDTHTEQGFMNSLAPGVVALLPNEYYRSEEDFLFAAADAMREEYKAIIDAGLILQIDDPSIADNWDRFMPEPDLDEYKKYIMTRVAAINHATRGLPEDRLRFHLCWGSWHGPHFTDLGMEHLIEVMLKINVGVYSFEAANPRHEHEWRLWENVALPEGKAIMPGVVSHATNVIEHPELIADRIVRFGEIVGRENVIASTDCGLGGRVHPQIAWTKLEALAQGADIATERLWK
jgi:5-methyltetrahydropteroyltriglutamate--homocysteine methyltransferase